MSGTIPKSRLVFIISAICILIFAFVLRVSIADFNRDMGINTDSADYHYTAKNLIKYHMFTRDRLGLAYNGEVEPVPAEAAQSGYPIYLAIVYSILGEDVSIVIFLNIVWSVMTIGLLCLILVRLKIKPFIIIFAMIILSIYPGTIYSNDFLLTEHPFICMFTAYVLMMISYLQTKKMWRLAITITIIMLAAYVRPLALPFVLLTLFFCLLYSKSKKEMAVSAAMVMGIALAMEIPLFIYNYIVFDKFTLASSIQQGPKVWGAQPYFIDMSSTNEKTLSEIIAINKAANPLVYYLWRSFGFLQMMWYDLWDEHLAHPVKFLRPFIILQQLIIVPSIAFIPLLVRKARKEVLFIACIPICYTLMYMIYHGLPRYVYPSIPMVVAVFAILSNSICSLIVHRTSKRENEIGLSPIRVERQTAFGAQTVINKIFRHSFFWAGIAFSLMLCIGVYFFSSTVPSQQSAFRLGRFMDTTISQVEQTVPVYSKQFGIDDVALDNVIRLSTEPPRYQTQNDVHDILTVSDLPLVNPSDDVVSRIDIHIKGGYWFDKTTVYWKGANTSEYSENCVYSLPRNFLQNIITVYIDDDVTDLRIVPILFRNGIFEFNGITVTKYHMSAT